MTLEEAKKLLIGREVIWFNLRDGIKVIDVRRWSTGLGDGRIIVDLSDQNITCIADPGTVRDKVTGKFLDDMMGTVDG